FIQGTTAGPGVTVNQNGDFTFNDTGNPNTTGLSIANAILGNFDTYSEFGAKAYTPYVANAIDLFAQDSWKVTPKQAHSAIWSALVPVAGMAQQMGEHRRVPAAILQPGRSARRGSERRFHRQRESV